MLTYPIELTANDNGTLLVTFPDLPEAAAVVETVDDVREQALDALEATLEGYRAQKRPIPMPSKPKCGQRVVHLPVLVATKVLLANELLSQGLRKADLARMMDVNYVQIDRLLKLDYPSKIGAVEMALSLLGRRLEVRVL